MAYPIDDITSAKLKIAQIRAALNDIDQRLNALETVSASLGTLAFQNADNVNITGGVISNIPARWG